MRILITGAGGFLGNQLVKDFLSTTNDEIFAITSQTDKLISQYGDYSRFRLIDTIPNNIDVLISCAFPRNTDGVSMAKGLDYITALYQEAVAKGVNSVINISSQSVYSSKRIEPATEIDCVDLDNKYAVGKYAVELLTNSMFSDRPHTNLRMASLIGVGFDQRITNKFVKQVVEGKDLQIVSGEQYFGFLDVRDATKAIVKIAASNAESWSTVYNLGTDEVYTLEKIAECTLEIGIKFGFNGRLKKCDDKAVSFNSALNCLKLKEQFGWTAQTPLKQTVEDLFASCVTGT